MSWIILQLDILYFGSPAPYTTTVQSYSKRRSSSFSSAKRLAGSLSAPAALRSSRSWSDFSFKTFFFSWIFLSLSRKMQLYLWSKYVLIEQVSSYAIQLGFDKATWKSSTGNKNSVTNNQIWENGKNRRLLLLAAAIEKLNQTINYIFDPKHCIILLSLYLIKSIPLSLISNLTFLFQVA